MLDLQRRKCVREERLTVCPGVADSGEAGTGANTSPPPGGGTPAAPRRCDVSPIAEPLRLAAGRRVTTLQAVHAVVAGPFEEGGARADPAAAERAEVRTAPCATQTVAVRAVPSTSQALSFRLLAEPTGVCEVVISNTHCTLRIRAKQNNVVALSNQQSPRRLPYMGS